MLPAGYEEGGGGRDRGERVGRESMGLGYAIMAPQGYPDTPLARKLRYNELTGGHQIGPYCVKSLFVRTNVVDKTCCVRVIIEFNLAFFHYLKQIVEHICDHGIVVILKAVGGCKKGAANVGGGCQGFG